jgi:hypothetical protein
MSATPWTPGPWVIQNNSNDSERALIEQQSTPQFAIARIVRFAGPGHYRHKANALLIQHAPEMAEALEQTAAAMDALHPSSAGDMSDSDYARLWNATRDRLEELSRRIRGDAP